MKLWKLFSLRRPSSQSRRLGANFAAAERKQRTAALRAELLTRATEPKLLSCAAALLAAAFAGLLVWIGYAYKWTGFHTKTLWDWLELAVVPVSLAIAAFLFNRSASNRDRDLAFERDFYALLGALVPRESSSAVVRGFVLSNLHLLGPSEKGRLIRALYETGLITGPTPTIDLRSAEFRGADLRGMNLKGANFTGVDLSDADLSETNLEGAILRDANLKRARVRYGKTFLRDALLEGTDLTDARLRRADLRNATLAWPRLEGTDLREADMGCVKVVETATFKGVDLRGARLHNAILRAASFDVKVRWDGAWYNSETQWPSSFTPPDKCKNVAEIWRPKV